MKSLKELFTEILASCKEHLTIVIDSLDQLRDYGAGLKDWVPKTLNKKIILVMSAIPGDRYRVVPELQVNNIFLYILIFMQVQLKMIKRCMYTLHNDLMFRYSLFLGNQICKNFVKMCYILCFSEGTSR